MVPDVSGIVNVLARWDGREPGPKISWRLDDYSSLEILFRYLWTVHRKAHAAGQPLPTVAVFLDEVSLAADRTAGADNPAVRFFTQAYQHRVIPIAITQRPAQTSRHILGTTWDWYVFSVAGDLDVLRTGYNIQVPDPAWIANPKDYHYYRCSAGAWFTGDRDGVERAVSTVPAPPEDALPPDEAPADGETDVAGHEPKRMPEVPPGISNPGETG